jgi:hypothetical protein
VSVHSNKVVSSQMWLLNTWNITTMWPKTWIISLKSFLLIEIRETTHAGGYHIGLHRPTSILELLWYARHCVYWVLKMTQRGIIIIIISISIFHLIFFCCIGIHCDIYKSAYNIS